MLWSVVECVVTDGMCCGVLWSVLLLIVCVVECCG